MSQRLHIGSTSEYFYDCVIDSPDVTEESVRREWMELSSGGCLGPWKIRIGDKTLYREIEPVLESVFASIDKEYPDDVWVFYESDRKIEHPTRFQLDQWLDEQIVKTT